MNFDRAQLPPLEAMLEQQIRAQQDGEQKLAEAMGRARHRYFSDAQFHARVKAAEGVLVNWDPAAALAPGPRHNLSEMLAFLLQVDDMIRASERA